MPGSRKTSRLRERATDRALSALAEELAALIDVARRRPAVEHIDDEEPDPLF